MKKQTTSKQLNTAITNNLLHITKAECSYKSSDRIDEISKETFRESMDYLIESGVFADSVGWHYEQDCKSNAYIAECGRMNPDTEIIISVYLRVCEGVSVESVDKVLLFEEE